MRIVVMVEGGIVQDVLSDRPCSYLLIDQDTEGFDEDRTVELVDEEGKAFRAGVCLTPATVRPEAVGSYFRQVQAAQKKGGVNDAKQNIVGGKVPPVAQGR